MENTETAAFSLLRNGQAPDNQDLLCELSEGIDFITDFWKEKYLQEYIKKGGSKIKFVTGRTGCGKTHLLNLFSFTAAQENYITVHFSARDIWMHDFKEVYVEILRQADILQCLKGCSRTIIAELGFDYHEIPDHMTLMDYLSDHDLADAVTRREIRLLLKKLFLDNPLLDNNFAIACCLLTGGLLGHPILEEQSGELLLAWISGEKSVKLSSLRALGLSPCKITKFNARHMLRSLTEVVRLAGYSGLLVTVDNLEILLNKSSLEPLHYTKLKREDTYESIRQLIDDIDSLRHIMFIFAFDRELLDHENAGIKSYQALWMRIQNEIIGERFNRFTDMVDLDRLAEQEYTPEVLIRMSTKLAKVMNREKFYTTAIDETEALALITQAKNGSQSIPRLVNIATLEVKNDV
ncbi:MAG: DUF2791 family P-loop domain-containing protein [Hungatella sp.]